MRLYLLLLALLQLAPAHAAMSNKAVLRGSNGSGRDWWDVTRYDLKIVLDEKTKTISGENKITFAVTQAEHPRLMQVDLQKPMIIDSVVDENNREIIFTREGNVYWLDLANIKTSFIRIRFSGKPHEAKNPPWDGGWIWRTDRLDRPWMSVAVQSFGASSWFPCKDYQGDEPDEGATISVTVQKPLIAIANGRGRETRGAFVWEVMNPINSYNIIPYMGHYVGWHDNFFGEKGPLDLDFWVLDYNAAIARVQFQQAAKTLRAFEYWFGPYPFYEDGFKLVEAPHLGMEHQSAVAYGNGFRNGYKGKDRSGSGWGFNWDFIIVHEVAHEWFGNNITTKDVADGWVHESFANYAETLFTDFYFGTEAGNDYCIGNRSRIKNDAPIIGRYGLHQAGSSDMYDKGGNMLHTIRQVINSDEKFRQILRGLNKEFYHQTVTTQQLERYISQKAGINLSFVFNQYLRTTMVPVLQYKINGSKLSFRWSNVVDGFEMPVKLTQGTWLRPTTQWQTTVLTPDMRNGIAVDRNFYVSSKKMGLF